jgi:hypothetical protein
MDSNGESRWGVGGTRGCLHKSAHARIYPLFEMKCRPPAHFQLIFIGLARHAVEELGGLQWSKKIKILSLNRDCETNAL